MSLLAVADCHIGDHPWCRGTVTAGVSERAQEGIDALARAVALANELQVDRLVVLGDLFDAARPAPVLVAAVQRVLALAPGPVVLVGNHDQESEAPGHHACAPLAPVAQIVDGIAFVLAGGVELVLLAPRSSRAPHAGSLEQLRLTDWPPSKVVRVLGLHLGIADKGTPVYLRESNDAILASAASYDLAAAVEAELVIAGNWHWPQAWKFPGDTAEVVQCGTLCPHDFRDAGQEGWAVHVGDDGKVTRHTIPGPRFHKVTSSAELEKRWPEGLPPHVYASVQHSPEQAAPRGARVRPVAVLPEADPGTETPAVDVHNVEQVIADHARSLVAPELAAEVEQRAREIWRNA